MIATFDDTDEKILSELIDFLKSKSYIEVLDNYQSYGCLECGDLLIDSKSRNVKIKGKPVRLTTKEFEILYLLASHPGVGVYLPADI